MRNYLIISVLLNVLKMHAQHAHSAVKESYIDSISYNYSMMGSHRDLVKIGRSALASNIDFYYLRYRLGVSYFNKKNYLIAAEHFRKALEFYPADFYTKEYLFYCYLFLNNPSHAYKILSKLPQSSQLFYQNLLGKQRLINVESGYQTTSYKNSQSASVFMGGDGIYAESDRMNSLLYQQIGINFPLSSKMKCYTGISYVQNNRIRHIYSHDFYYLYDVTKKAYSKETKLMDTAQAYDLKQFQGYIGVNICLPKRYDLQLGFQNMYYNQKKIGASSDSVKSTNLDTLIYNYRYQINSSNRNNFVSSMTLSKTFSKINTSMGLGYALIDNVKVFQAGSQLTYSPFGNYNLNFSGGYFTSIDTEVRNIGYIKIGGRITNQLWYETYHYTGNLKNFHESNAYVVYNISDSIKSKTGINMSYYFRPDWIINFRYERLVRSAAYTRYFASGTHSLNDDYMNHSFIVNLIWKF